MVEVEWLDGEDSGASAKRNVPEILSYIFSMQSHFFSGIIIGLHLNEADLLEIENQLTQDDLVEGSVGRYRRYPVYKSELPPNENEYRLAYDGIVFTYFPLS